MKGIFISHSTKNRQLVEQFVEFLKLGMGIDNGRIFCTSINGTLPTGTNFVEVISREVQEREMVIALITPEYLESRFCMMELGAAWIEAQYLCPILAGGVDYSDLKDTPLAGVQMRKIDSEDDLCAVYDEMVRQEFVSVNIAQFNKKRAEFLKELTAVEPEQGCEAVDLEESGLYRPDSEGYYYVTVEKERPVPAPYKCYKIKGRLFLGTEEKDDTLSHWIFYQKDVFVSLKAGDRVCLKVAKTQRRFFPDIGLARNIYPENMHVMV